MQHSPVHCWPWCFLRADGNQAFSHPFSAPRHRTAVCSRGGAERALAVCFPTLHRQSFSTAGGWKGQDYGKKEELEKKSFVPRNCLGAFNRERKWLLDPNNSGSPSPRAQQPAYTAINSAGDAPQWPLAWREELWGQPGDNTSCHWAKHTMAAWWKTQIFPHCWERYTRFLTKPFPLAPDVCLSVCITVHERCSRTSNHIPYDKCS